ncbi:nitroreductase family protein [Candidatus Omnitrophota bacterium]
MSVYSAALNRRSIRRFRQKPISPQILKKLINAARLAPTGANLQPCEFILVNQQEIVKKIFPGLKWAGYIRPAGNPPAGKRPTAYIAVLLNQKKKPLCGESDAAAAAENILLVAQEQGLGSCWLGAIDKDKIRKILRVPSYCQIMYVIALGYPDEQPKLEAVRTSIAYWQDKNGRLHVPKRSLKEILHTNVYKK